MKFILKVFGIYYLLNLNTLAGRIVSVATGAFMAVFMRNWLATYAFPEGVEGLVERLVFGVLMIFGLLIMATAMLHIEEEPTGKAKPKELRWISILDKHAANVLGLVLLVVFVIPALFKQS